MDSETPNVLIIGAGGVGVIVALSLYTAGKCNVSLVVRSDYKHVLEHGYKISSVDYGEIDGWRPHRLYRTVDAIAEGDEERIFFDYIVITTKNIPDGPADSRVPHLIRPVLESNHTIDATRQTNIVLIQNGIDIEKEVLQSLDKALYNYTLLSGVMLIGSHKVSHGVIKHVTHDHLSVGAFESGDAAATAAARGFIALYNNDKSSVEFDLRVRYSRWKKLLYNAVIGVITTLVDLDVPRTLQFGVNGKSTENELFRPAMKEIIAIAAAEGIVIDEKVIDFFIDASRDLVYKPSMCLDAEHDQLMELEVILGNPVRIAKAHRVQTPILSTLYNLLVLIQGRIKEKRGLIRFDEESIKVVE